MPNTRKKIHDKNAPKIVKRSLAIFGKTLIYIGKPFYFILTSVIIFLFFLSKLTGKSIFKLTNLLLKIFKTFLVSIGRVFFSLISLPSLIAKTLGRFELPKPKIVFPSPPKLKTPDLKLPRLKIKKPQVVFFAIISLALFSFWLLILKGLPSPKDLTSRNVEASTKIYDRNGVLLYKIYEDKNRTLVPLSEIPMTVRLATIAAEDSEFYLHPGFSMRGMLRAGIKNLTTDELSGGSTITQQLVKNALLSSEKTLVRKLREIVLAMEVELTFSKDEILEMYLNEVSYGGTAYGIQEAARLYFDKDVQELTLSEATFLAGLPKSPTSYSPFGPTPEAGQQRQKDVLRLMEENGFITKEQQQKALNEKLVFAENKIDIKAPHFVMYVKGQLSEKYGEEVVEKGGLEVHTTLDYSIQKMAQDVVKEELERIERLNVGNGGVLVLNPKTGEVLAMVGSKDYFDTKKDGNVNVVTSKRQPGSSIKVVNYAYALSNGYTPASIISDTPITFSVPGQPPYSPKNYDGKYRGRVTLRSALAESRNIPAVKVLATYGVNKMIEMGQEMGIETWNEKGRYGLSLTLGGGDVTLLDLSQVYATIANYGKRPEIATIISVKNSKGKTLEENGCVDDQNPPKGQSTTAKLLTIKKALAAEASTPCNWPQVLKEGVAFMLIDILSDNSARAPAFGSYSQLTIPQHPEVAVKTGTSNDLRDNLTVGFNQNYLVSVWVGNNDNSPMSRVASGVTGASPIFNQIMSRLLADQPSVAWEPPEEVERVAVCRYTGTLPCTGCPTTYEWFLGENTPRYACVPERVAEISERENEGQILDEAASTEYEEPPAERRNLREIIFPR